MKQLLAPISRLRIGDIAPALGAYLAIGASTAPSWAPAASETTFLAWFAGAVLLAAALLDRRACLPTAMLVVTAAWILPPGASRGMAVSILLALALGAGAWMRRSELGSALVTLPLAIGLQILLRAEDFVGATSIEIAEVLLPAILTAGAVAWLAEPSKNFRLAAVAAASVVIVGCFDSGLAIAFLVFAGGKELSKAGRSKLTLASSAVGLVLLGFWEPRATLLAAAATMVLLGSRRMRILGATLATAAGFGSFFLAGPTSGQALVQLSWLAIALPAAWLPGRHRARWLAGLVIAWAGTRILPLGSAPAAALLLLALESEALAWSLQKRWSAISLAGVVSMSIYPWFRLDPAADALARIGLEPSPLTALVMIVVVAFFASAHRWLPRAEELALIALACCILVHLPRPTISLVGYEPVDLGPTRSRIAFETPATKTRWIAVGASASNSLGLEAGTALATIKIRGRDDRMQSWTLEAGQDVGEWAARRADLRDQPSLEWPRPWVAWSVPLFFGRSFRSLHELDGDTEVVEVEIERHPDIAPAVGLRIDHLDLRPGGSP